ncbi:glycosyltransferase [bacterium]|nr:glycosyltransferase [bacterium]MCP5462686.1 glycosyltransferase [bacterium]
MPKVSVIMPSYNCAHYLPNAIQSVLNQTFEDYEIVVIDDGSTDSTKDLMQAYVEKYPQKIRYIYQKNKGLSGARNTGIENACGEYIALLDADDLWLPERLKAQIDFLKKHPEYSFVFSDVYAMDENGKRGKTMMRLKKPVSGDIFYELLLENFISVPTTLIKKDCFKNAGFYSSDMKLCEDHHFSLRLANYYKGGYIDQPLACYMIRSNSLSSSLLNMRIWDMKVVDEMARLFPERVKAGSKYFKQARANLLYEMGYISYRQNNFKDAWNYLWKSLKVNGFFMPAVKSLLILSCIPHNLLRKRNQAIPTDETGLFESA